MLYRLSIITADSKINVITVHILYYPLHLIFVRKMVFYIPSYVSYKVNTNCMF